MGIFDEIDFNNLPPWFNEECVREEIIAPLLKALGYSATNDTYKILRGFRLEHPYKQFGVTLKHISIIPDYIIQIENKNRFIVEAKAPSENITSGNHIAQAFSYASHVDVLAEKYVLCNGRELVIFSTFKKEPLYHMCFPGDETQWNTVFEMLSPLAFTKPYIFNFVLDYGLWCVKAGHSQDYIYNGSNMYINLVTKLDEESYSIFLTVKENDCSYAASFDFHKNLFKDFMAQVPTDKRELVYSKLTSQPFSYEANCKEESFPVSFSAQLTYNVFHNENEDYIPFLITSFH